jgi:hypothetical protein
MELVNETYFVYSMDKNQTEILEEYCYYNDEEGAFDIAYRLKKYSEKVFIRKEFTYEYDEE